MRKIIVDCDPGHDDIVAIVCALAHPEQLDVLGLTTVCGNNLLDNVTRNLCQVMTVLKRNCIISKGYDSPMVYHPEPQRAAHGENGLAGPELPEPVIEPISLHAIEFMKEMALKHGKITLVALAPLTNVALFLKTYPELKQNIECITLMGGSRYGGNILERSEFNIYADPHAARIVFESGVPIVMSGLEICQECSTPHALIDSLHQGNEAMLMIHDILQFFSEYNRKRNRDCSPIFDVVPVMHLLHPELFETESCAVHIELDGKYTRGMTVFNENDTDSLKNVTVLTHCKDTELYNQYLLNDLISMMK